MLCCTVFTQFLLYRKCSLIEILCNMSRKVLLNHFQAANFICVIISFLLVIFFLFAVVVVVVVVSSFLISLIFSFSRLYFFSRKFFFFNFSYCLYTINIKYFGVVPISSYTSYTNRI